MRWMYAIVLGLIVVAGVAFSAPPVAMPRAATNMGEDNNVPAVVVQANMGGPMAQMRGPVRAQIETTLKRMGIPVEEANKYIERAQAMRGRAREIISHADEVRKRFRQMAPKYKDVTERMRRSAEMFRQKEQEWMQIRQKYMAGEIDENTYLVKTKEFVLAAIDATIDRLEAIKEDEDVNVDGIEAAIEQLQTLRESVENAETIEDLRAIYPEVRSAIREAQNRYVFKEYVRMTARYGEGIVAQLEVAAARLTAVVEDLKAKGEYDENIDATVTALFARIDAIKTELNALETAADAGEITPEEFAQRVRELRAEIREVYFEIRDLYREYTKKLALRVRTRTELNAPEDRNTVRAEVEGVPETAAEEVNAA